MPSRSRSPAGAASTPHLRRPSRLQKSRSPAGLLSQSTFPQTKSRSTSARRRAAASLDLPERLREVGPDAEDDVTARGQGPAGMQVYMNQSVISLVTRTGGLEGLQSRFVESEDESEEEGQSEHRTAEERDDQDIRIEKKNKGKQAEKEKHQTHKRNFSNKLAHSMAKWKLKTIKEKNRVEEDMMSSSQILTPSQQAELRSPLDSGRPAEDETGESSEAPLLSRRLKAEADMNAQRPSFDESSTERRSSIEKRELKKKKPLSLIQTVMEIFGFETPEEVIAEYPCWLLQSVLLQGYMYVTQKHVCFYAYLPKKNNVILKSGYLSKRGKSNPRYNRYWFQLKGDVLSYYADANNKYFQSGNIDLRYGISANMVDTKEKSKDPTGFCVTTHQRTYYFRADSTVSAKEWVKQLQRIIFRSHNDGDSVKISLPTENIIDLEESHVVGFADTIKIRVFDNDETYAMDEYFFSFFSFAEEAIHVLKLLVEDNLDRPSPTRARTDGPKQAPHERPQLHVRAATEQDVAGAQRSPLSPKDQAHSTSHRGVVRSTLAPQSPTMRSVSGSRMSGDSPRSSFDVHRRSVDTGRELGRASFDRGRQSISRDRSRMDKSPFSPKRSSTTDSISRSLGHTTTDSSAVIQSLDESNASASASGILERSDCFANPTVRQQLSNDPSNLVEGRRSQDTARETALRSSPQPSMKPYPARKGSPLSPSPHTTDTDDNDGQFARKSMSGSTLKDYMAAGASSSLHRASGIAGAIKSQTARMSNLIASRPMGYYEKVSGMWAGGKKHYPGHEHGAVGPDGDEIVDFEDEQTAAEAEVRFREHFGLPDTERLQATYFGHLSRVIPLYGKIYVGTKHFCFRTMFPIPGTRTKLVLPLKDIENVHKEKGFRIGYKGLVVVIRGHEELFFEFPRAETQADCAVTLLRILESLRFMSESDMLSEESLDAEAAKNEHNLLREARKEGLDESESSLLRDSEVSEEPNIFFDDPRVSIINFKPTEPLRITCLTIGSRGDVQPYIALCKGLIAEGHKPKIATHAEFGDWVKKHGIDFAPVGGNPAELMQICVDNGMFTYSFMKEANAKFKGWLDELCLTAWEACQGSGLLIESPSAMCGIHIAEALEIPYFRAFTMPWTRTRSYPHAFATQGTRWGGFYNYSTYVLFDAVFWKAIAPQMNRFRKKTLGLGSTNTDKMQANKVPFLYNFSPHVVYPPLDFSDWVRITGYWFLDEATEWKPDNRLANFIKSAREDNKKLVYIGFGSITVDDRAALVRSIANAVVKADVRCIWASGWSARHTQNTNADGTDVLTLEELAAMLPPEVLQIDGAPHDWLFKQVDAAVHHGGAGTTGASLRAGIPTVIKPFFGDQFFFAHRVEDMGVGMHLRKLNESLLARALWEASHSQRMIDKARDTGEKIRSEDGVANAIKFIYRDMEYAKSLIKRRTGNTADEEEESWTFIGDEGDPELQRQIDEFHAHHGSLAPGVGESSGAAEPRDAAITDPEALFGTMIGSVMKRE